MERILVIHRGSLGDFLLLAPSLGTLRRSLPEARIELLGRTEIQSLLCPGIADSIASVERSSLVPLFEDSAGLPEEAIQYFSSFNAILAFVSDPGRILERNLAWLGIENLLVRPPFPPQGERVHVGEYLFEGIAALLNLHASREETAGPASLLHFEADEVREAEAFLDRAGPETQPTVAVHPGSGSEGKCWPMERFEALVRWLNDTMGCSIALILGPADERLVERTRNLGEELDCPIAHNLPLRRLAAVLSKCGAYVGNDSGVTHLAAVAGIPTLAVFGPTDPAVWGPVGKNARIITGDAACNPCTRETMRQCEHRDCLDSIDVEDVARALRAALP